MNFFSVGFVLCALNFNLGWELNYALRIVGTLFMLSGIEEADSVSEGFADSRPLVAAGGAVSVLGTAVALMIRFGALNAAAGNLLSMILGAAALTPVLLSQRKILLNAQKHHDLVNDPSLLEALVKVWKKYAFFAAFSVGADILYRLLPDGYFQAYIGTAEVVTRIIMYVYVVLLGTAFARVVRDFNIMHPTV